MTDPVAEAVAEVAAKPQQIRMVRREFTSVATGRPVAIEYPADIQLVEMLTIIGWVTNEMPRFAEQDRLAAAGIVLPAGAAAGLRRT